MTRFFWLVVFGKLGQVWGFYSRPNKAADIVFCCFCENSLVLKWLWSFWKKVRVIDRSDFVRVSFSEALFATLWIISQKCRLASEFSKNSCSSWRIEGIVFEMRTFKMFSWWSRWISKAARIFGKSAISERMSHSCECFSLSILLSITVFAFRRSCCWIVENWSIFLFRRFIRGEIFSACSFEIVMEKIQKGMRKYFGFEGWWR